VPSGELAGIDQLIEVCSHAVLLGIAEIWLFPSCHRYLRASPHRIPCSDFPVGESALCRLLSSAAFPSGPFA
jgi:hypothetical protein